jgi:hypothetical protein
MEMNVSTIINRSVEVVFAYVSDVSNDAQWLTGIDKSWLDPGETMGLGVTGHSQAGEMEISWRVDKFVAGECIEWELLDRPFERRGGYHLKPVQGGTEITLLVEMEPVGVYKLLGPLAGWLGRRRNRVDAERLKEVLESRNE